MSLNKFLLLACLALSASVGCVAGSEESDASEATASSESKLSLGTWVSGYAAPAVWSTTGALQVCRGIYDGGYHPGFMWQGSDDPAPRCRHEWGGTVIRNPNYELLQGSGYYWVGAYNYPWNAVDGGQAGYSAGYQHTVVCEVSEADGRWHPGKYWAGKCRYEYGGKAKALAPSTDVYGNWLVHFLVH